MESQQPDAPVDEVASHPYDVIAQKAGEEMWEWSQEWRVRHQLTRAQYLWVASRMIAVELQAMSLQEVKEYDERRK